MPDLTAILDRLTKDIETDADIAALRQAIQSGQITVATGTRAVAVGGGVTDAVIVSGDGNVMQFFKGLDALALQKALGHPIDAARSAPGREGGRPAQFVPNRFFHKLVGREAYVDNIMAALRDPAGKWIVGIDGMGGIGKTALAREIVDRCLAERSFDTIVWEQSAREALGARKNNRTFDLEAALDAIARQLGMLNILRLGMAEKEARVRALLQNQRVLVVLDNLETAKQPQDEIAQRLTSLLNPSKALLTSRIRFKGDVYPIHLAGLNEDGACLFIHQEAQEKQNARVGAGEPDELKAMASTTGGSPLALKLVAGQAAHLPLEVVLNQLRHVRMPEQGSAEDDYVLFYKGIFFPSWQLVTETGKGLLISMAHFAPGIGGTYDAVKATSDLVEHVLPRCVDELWRFSFLELGEAPRLSKARYYLHALTLHFVLSDIVQIVK